MGNQQWLMSKINNEQLTGKLILLLDRDLFYSNK